MRFNTNWLRDWVDSGLGTDELAHRLTMAGLEVDEVAPAAEAFDGVVVAEVVSAGPHPNADRLKVCEVDAGGDRRLQIVCGAPNARVGLKAPLAMVGATLPGGFNIKAAELRGVPSQGMLCSARELGLSEDASGLMELPSDASAGADLRDYLALNDDSIEVDLTPNRGDCLSIRGIARDVAAITGGEFKDHPAVTVDPQIQETLEVNLHGSSDCARYVGRVIQGVDPTAETPLWMQEKLRRCGLRPIKPSVDVTNYVMLELGQPMHAFDRDKLTGPISVRRAVPGETLTLLDGTEASLDEEFLLITDNDRAVALGGLMGGDGTAVGDDTRNLFMEAAWFKPSTIIGRARRVGVHSDAAHRFERGVDPQLQVRAMERATELLLEIVGGQAGPIIEAVESEHLPQAASVTLRASRVNLLMGVPVDRTQVESILTGLGMSSVATDDGWEVTPPSTRFDIEREVDLIEEVARIYGYDQLPEANPGGDLPVVTEPEQLVQLGDTAARLVDLGYCEAITYSFVSPEVLKPMKGGAAEQGFPLANPLSGDMAVMRTSLIPGLLGALVQNQNRQQETVRLFETGVAFPYQGGVVSESMRIAGVAAGSRVSEQWSESRTALDFFDIKGDVESLLALTGLADEFSFARSELAYLHPGQSATVVRGEQVVGWVGALHPAWGETADVRGPVFGFELNFAGLQPSLLPKAEDLSRFPSIRRDLAFDVREDVSWQRMQQIIEETAGNLLTRLVVFDEYKGRGIPEGQKSLAFGMVLQDQNQNLTNEAADGVVEAVVSELTDQLSASLRG